MQDFTARAMLARNSMNVYLKLNKFLISTKLTYGVEIPYLPVLRQFLVGQFGPVTKGRGGNASKGDYFYQCVRALEDCFVLKIQNPQNYVKAAPVRDAPLEAINRVREDTGCDMFGEEYFEVTSLALDQLYNRFANYFPSKAKLIHFLILNGYEAKDFEQMAKLETHLAKEKAAE